jgi:hypothetical protein
MRERFCRAHFQQPARTEFACPAVFESYGAGPLRTLAGTSGVSLHEIKCCTSPARTALALRYIAVAALASVTMACRRDMQDQPKYIPLRPSDFFADGRSARPLPEGTVARGELRADKVFFTGKRGDLYVDQIPFPVTREVLDRGQERFNIYCSPCHSRLGDGQGMIVKRGFKRPPSYHIDRLREAQVGYFYDVISNGFGAMADYSSQVAPRDRWAIAAYIRVLQFSQQASINDVPPECRQELNGAAAKAPEQTKPQE